MNALSAVRFQTYFPLFEEFCLCGVALMNSPSPGRSGNQGGRDIDQLIGTRSASDGHIKEEKTERRGADRVGLRSLSWTGPRVLFLYFEDLVAAARDTGKSGPVQDRQHSPVVSDELFILKVYRSAVDGFPPDTEHPGEKCLCDGEFVGAHSVRRHQEPSRESGPDRMKSITGRGQ